MGGGDGQGAVRHQGEIQEASSPHSQQSERRRGGQEPAGFQNLMAVH